MRRVQQRIQTLVTKHVSPATLRAAALPALLVSCTLLLYLFAQLVTPANVKVASLAIRRLAEQVHTATTMDGLVWVIVTWGVVGAVCYYALNRLGLTAPPSQQMDSNGTAQRTTVTPSHASNNGANCEWANDLIAWVYANLRRVPAPLEAWIKSLNEAAKKVTNPSKCEILFESFGDHSHIANAPKLRNVRVQPGPRDHVTLRTDIHIPQARLKLVSSQRGAAQRMIVTNYEVDIIDLRGEIEARIACIAGQLYVMGCFSGRPEMDIQLRNADSTASAEVDRALVEDAIRRCLVSAVTNVNLSDIGSVSRASMDLDHDYKRLSAQGIGSSPYSTANRTSIPPKLGKSPQTSFNASFDGRIPDAPLIKKQYEYELTTLPQDIPQPNKLKVNVIKAAKLGKGIEVTQPYVVLETDEPPQRFQTSKGINASPYWEEQFEFDLNTATEEMLFEVYEGKHLSSNEDIFLGLAIVNLAELQQSHDNMHNLNLQARPYRNDAVQGQITCQFDFYHDPNVKALGKHSETVIVKDRDGGEFRETVSTQRRALYDPHDNIDDFVPTKTTTVTVKTVSQTLKDKPTIQSVHGSMENAMDPVTQRQVEDRLREHHLEPIMTQSLVSTESAYSHGSELGPRAVSTQPPDVPEERPSRDRKKQPKEKRDRSFFGAMRDRLSGRRSKSAKRAQSFDLHAEGLEGPGETAVSVPASRDISRTRYNSDQGGYTEASSVGGRSGESSKSLYQHSTLVLELNHKGSNKYYLIPPAMLAEPAAAKLMKRGKKLHIYNEHTFVAVKCRSNTECDVCHNRIGHSFSKQAYQCRDCKLVSHKSCHYKTDAFCTQSSVSKLPIEKDVDWMQFISSHQLEEFISMDGV